MTKLFKILVITASMGALMSTGAFAHDVKTQKLTKAEITKFYEVLRADTKNERDAAPKNSFTFTRAAGELKLMDKLSKGDWDRDFCIFLCTSQMEKDINDCAKSSVGNGGTGSGIPEIGSTGLPGLSDEELEEMACLMAAAMRAGECNSGC